MRLATHHNDIGPALLAACLDAICLVAHVVFTMAAGGTNVHNRKPDFDASATGFKVFLGLLHYLLTALEALAVPPNLHLTVKVAEGLVVCVIYVPRDRLDSMIMAIGIVPMVQRIMISSALMAKPLKQGMAVLVLCFFCQTTNLGWSWSSSRRGVM